MSAITNKELPTRLIAIDAIGEQNRNIPAGAPMPSASLCQAGTAMHGCQHPLLVPREIICSFDSLYNAMLRCRQNVMWKDSTAGYVANGLTNIVKLRNGLLNEQYSMDKYAIFYIYEPKLRKIVSTRIKDRVFQRSLCDNYFYDEMTKHFIYDNCACQNNRGTDFALNRLKRHLQHFNRRHGTQGWVYKFDIHDYFGKTKHAVAINAVEKRVSDEWVIGHVKVIVRSFNQGEALDTGMGLGSQITQIIELAVLDDMDHFIKEELKIKYYVRYNDDFILIHQDKEYLKYCRKRIEEKLVGLGLTLNEKKSQLYSVTNRIRFLGFSYQLKQSGKVVMRILPENVKKERRKLKKLVGRVAQGYMTRRDVDECYTSWKAHAKRGDTHNEILKMDAYYKSLWKEYYHVQLQRYQGAVTG